MMSSTRLTFETLKLFRRLVPASMGSSFSTWSITGLKDTTNSFRTTCSLIPPTRSRSPHPVSGPKYRWAQIRGFGSRCATIWRRFASDTEEEVIPKWVRSASRLALYRKRAKLLRKFGKNCSSERSTRPLLVRNPRTVSQLFEMLGQNVYLEVHL